MNTYSVAILPNFDGEVLILRRSFTAPYGDLKWSLPGGKVDDGEEPIEAVVRELEEELNIILHTSDFKLQFQTVEVNEGGEEYVVNYFSSENGLVERETITLNYENDKLEFVNQETLQDYEFIPNHQEIIDFFFDGKKQEILTKSWVDLLDSNPFDSEFQKAGKLDTAKLQLKDIVDKLGRHMKKWVKGDEPIQQEKQTKTEEQPQQRNSNYDYNSVYKDPKKVLQHAKKSSSEDLKAFLEKDHDNPKASYLVSAAKEELKKRGEEYVGSEEDKNPYDKKEDSSNDDKNVKKEEPVKKEEVKKEPDFSKISPEEKIQKYGFKEMHDGFYNPETGAGWSGDEDLALDDKQKREISNIGHSIVANIKTMMDPNSPKLMTIISGKAGVGKSHNVKKAVEEMGYDTINQDDDFDPREHSNGSYVEVKGSRMNYGDFLTNLFKYRGDEGSKTLVSFDDSDNMLFDKNTINLLKNFEGGTPTITIPDQYKSKIAKSLGIQREDVPNQFDFNGRLNFITNKGLGESQDTAALKGRSNQVHIDLDKKQMLYAVSTMLKGKLKDGYDNFKENKELYDVLIKNQKNLDESDLQVRTLGSIKSAKMAFQHLPKETQNQYKGGWKDYYAEQLKSNNLKKAEEALIVKTYIDSNSEIIKSFESLILGES